mmetsp:Transcript_1995/g.3523  ORF Transcript_1995/g.3523 Transcript_1995/m.3523 type:complete len:203 (+) Transcript_1995:767-1375(+)
MAGLKYTEGFDILRLSNPPIDLINEDFICSVCHKIINVPRECQNPDCGQLLCKRCCKRDDNQCELCTGGLMKNPSKLIMKIYSKYEITCNICCKPFQITDVLQHEQTCSKIKCNNELCGVELKQLIEKRSQMQRFSENERAASAKQQQIVRFQLNGNEMLACSKKCKKITKFAHILKKNNENEILKTFETMLRKKMQKNLEH